MGSEMCIRDRCKNNENRLRFDKVAESLKVGPFLRHGVDIVQVSVVQQWAAHTSIEEHVQLQVGGNTIYNMLKLGDGETDVNEKPHYPHKIIKTKVNSCNLLTKLLIYFSVWCLIYTGTLYRPVSIFFLFPGMTMNAEAGMTIHSQH